MLARVFFLLYLLNQDGFKAAIFAASNSILEKVPITEENENTASSGDLEANSYCRQPGMKCDIPQGGVCQRPSTNSELMCDCPSSHTKVAIGNQNPGGHICQIKLMNIHCLRDHDFACLLVKDSVCNPAGGHCVCPVGYIYVAHRHQCKRRYPGNHAYCEACRKEFGICFEEDDLAMSDGPHIQQSSGESESATQFRLSCSCPLDKGVSRFSLTDWKSPVCSVMLMDLGEECNDRELQCRSKRAICTQSRDQESDWRRCLCPQRHVAVFQSWLRYYECFEEMDMKSVGCEQCAQSQPFGICFSTNNATSGTGCACPKRLSTPKGSTKFCSKHHVSVTCGGGTMVVRFDPNYQEAPYDNLLDRLQSKRAVAFVESSEKHLENEVCELRPRGSIYQVTLNATGVDLCGSRAIRVTRREGDHFRYEARLLVLYNRNFYTYPDIQLTLFCTTPNHSSKQKNNNAVIKDVRAVSTNNLPSASQVELALRVLDTQNQLVKEIIEDEHVRLDIFLEDSSGYFTSFLVHQCLVSNRSQSATSELPSASPIAATQIIKCGGLDENDEKRLPVGASGFVQGFMPINGPSGFAAHQQTRPFKAFRLGNSPSVYFTCAVRICTAQLTRFCHKSNCLDKTKRSPDDGMKVIEKEVYFVVIRKQSSTRQHAVAYCSAYSICLTTNQIVIIILVLLTVLALTCGMVIVIYRRRMLFRSQRLTQLHSEDDCFNPMEVGKHQQLFVPSTPTNIGVISGSSIHRQYPCSMLDSQISPSECGANCAAFYDRYNEHIASSRLECDKDRCDSLLRSRPDVCTCDQALHCSLSVTSSQV